MRRCAAILLGIAMLVASSAAVCSAGSVLAAAKADACCRTSCPPGHQPQATRCCGAPAADAAAVAPVGRTSASQPQVSFARGASAMTVTRARGLRLASAIDPAPPPLIVSFERLCSLQI